MENRVSCRGSIVGVVCCAQRGLFRHCISGLLLCPASAVRSRPHPPCWVCTPPSCRNPMLPRGPRGPSCVETASSRLAGCKPNGYAAASSEGEKLLGSLAPFVSKERTACPAWWAAGCRLWWGGGVGQAGTRYCTVRYGARDRVGKRMGSGQSQFPLDSEG